MKQLIVDIPEGLKGFASVSPVYSRGDSFSADESEQFCRGFDLSSGGPCWMPLPRTHGGGISWVDNDGATRAELTELIQDMEKTVAGMKRRLSHTDRRWDDGTEGPGGSHGLHLRTCR